MSESTVRILGLAASICYAALIIWLYVHQPQTFAEASGGLTATIGAYQIDRPAFDEGLRLFHSGQFEAALAAFNRADPGRTKTRQRSSTSHTASIARAGDAFTMTIGCSHWAWKRRIGPLRCHLMEYFGWRSGSYDAHGRRAARGTASGHAPGLVGSEPAGLLKQRK